MDKTDDKSILIVDDDPGMCETLTDILDSKGYRTRTVFTAALAVKALSEPGADWDVAIVDVILPDTRGMELVDRIRELAPDTQIILLTAYASVDTAVNGIRSKVIDYLQKPVDLDYLIATIKRAVEHRERIALEQAIRNAASEWRRTFDAIPNMIMMLDPDYTILRVNQASRDFLDLPYQEIIGKKCHDLFCQAEVPPENCVIKRSLETGAGEQDEVFIESAQKHFHVTTTPINDDAGEFYAVVHVMHDITERKLMEARVLESEKLASVGQLAAGVAHEINNPLSFIMTNSDQLAGYVAQIMELYHGVEKLVRQGGDPKQIEALERLEREHDMDYIREDLESLLNESIEGMIRIRNIVSDLRKFAYVGEEEAELVDINGVVTSALNMAKSQFMQRGRVDFKPGKTPGVFINSGRLAQAVLNLIINAAQSLDPARAGENLITISTGVGGGRIFIRVADTGSGISEDRLTAIFAPFYTTNPAAGNTGLGLTIANDIIKKLGGEISVESVKGRGSVFTTWLPVEAGSRPGKAEEEPESAPEAEDLAPRILIVDDEHKLLESMKRLLGRKYRLVLASSGARALEEIGRDDAFDLIICDLMMPEMDGKALYEEITRRKPQLDSRFMFLTGGAYTPELQDFFRRMKHRTVEKPLRGAETLRIIEAVLADMEKG